MILEVFLKKRVSKCNLLNQESPVFQRDVYELFLINAAMHSHRREDQTFVR